MKKVTSALAKASFLLTVLLVVLTSCSKEKTTPPTVVTPPVVTKPTTYLNVSILRDTAFMGGSDTVSFSSDGIVKLNGSSEVSNPIPFSNITNEINFQLSAVRTVNNVASDPKVDTVKIPLYSWNKTNLVNEHSIKWVPDSTKSCIVADSLVDPTPTTQWGMAPPDLFQYRFYTNNTGTGYGPNGNGTFNYYFLNGDTWIFFSLKKKIINLTSNKMILGWWQKDALGTNVWFYSQTWFHGI